ncbi:DUF397 domain-containing protein [Streptomyces sp. NPDC050508]|uniref:DUF397 domain-containing protein n=1 Tax=Streptomyces sp. NPDC050508 TaxID=3155405 RepID=UPI00343CF0DA
MQWQKSSFSGIEGGNCLELAHHKGRILLRESETPGDVLDRGPAPHRRPCPGPWSAERNGERQAAPGAPRCLLSIRCIRRDVFTAMHSQNE